MEETTSNITNLKRLICEAVGCQANTPSGHILLHWNPGREMEAEYLGNHTFRIVRCEGSKLDVNDTFQASVFALGHSAMLANVIHGETSFPLYEIGQIGGLTLANLVKK